MRSRRRDARPRARGARWALLAALAALLAGAASSEGPAALTVAISPDLPPYVIEGATSGLEVDLVRQALPGRAIRFVQLPYAQLQTAVPGRHADAAVGVQHFADDGVAYSEDFITFENAAITKKAANIAIARVADLAGHPVLAWEDAYLELGPEFERLYAPGGPQRDRYVEVADQSEQVRRFWEAPAAVAVIDRTIFGYFSVESGHALDEVSFAAIFPPVTNFKVGFADASLRDAFDRGLAGLCESGAYAKLLARYRVVLPRTVCDR